MCSRSESPEFRGNIQACAEEFLAPSERLGWSDDALQLGALMGFRRYFEPRVVFSGN
jgi:hypothetical protein